MGEVLNMAKLHSKEDRPSAWIWISIKSSSIKKIYSKILKHREQEEIGKDISKKLNAGLSTVVKHLIRIKKCEGIIQIPLPILIELNKLRYNDKDISIYQEIIDFKCKNYNAQTIKIPKEMNRKIARIIGAHISDGYLKKGKDKAYSWKVTEGRKDLIIKLNGWVREFFDLETNIWHYKRDNMWICSSGNKIFCRYLEKIINIPTGKKSHIIREPKIVKRGDLKIRNGFLAGMLNFDGCVKTSGTISLTSMSKNLIRDVKEILDKNKIKTNVTFNTKKKSWIIETSKSRNKEDLKKLLNFFERGTHKYRRLKFLAEDNKHYSIEEMNQIFPKQRLGKTSLKEVYDASKRLVKFKTNKLANSCEVSQTSLYKYLHILEKSGILNKSIKLVKTNENGYREATYHFKGA